MSYNDEYHPKVRSDLKKLDKNVAKEIHDVHLDKVLREPHAGEELHGELTGVSAFHFRKNKVDYRIAYSIHEAKKVVTFIMIGKRENFYDLLKRRLS